MFQYRIMFIKVQDDKPVTEECINQGTLGVFTDDFVKHNLLQKILPDVLPKYLQSQDINKFIPHRGVEFSMETGNYEMRLYHDVSMYKVIYETVPGCTLEPDGVQKEMLDQKYKSFGHNYEAQIWWSAKFSHLFPQKRWWWFW